MWKIHDNNCCVLKSKHATSAIAYSRHLQCKKREQNSGAPNGNFRENICSEDDLRSRIFGAFVVKFLACLPFLGFSNIYKMV